MNPLLEKLRSVLLVVAFCLLACWPAAAQDSPVPTIVLRGPAIGVSDGRGPVRLTESGVLADAKAAGGLALLNVATRKTVGLGESFSTLAAWESAIARRLPDARAGRIRLEILGDSPPKSALGFAIVVGPDIAPGSVLRSPTTKTLGLVADLDFTPDGRGVAGVAGADAEARVFRRDRRVIAGESARVGLMIGYGALIAFAVVGAIAFRNGANAIRAAFRFLLSVCATAPVGLMLAGLATSRAAHIGIAIGASVALAVLSLALDRRFRGRNSVRIASGILTFAVPFDALTGFSGVGFSALSANFVGGIRFYGIGNEYMGLWLGAAIIATPIRALPGVLAVLVVLIGGPVFGANAGGAMAAAAGEGMATFRHRRLRVSLPLSFLVAILAALALALWERQLPASAQSHIGRAAGAGFGAWREIVARKLTMNLRLAFTAPMLATLLGLAVAVVFARRSGLLGRVWELVAASGVARRLPILFVTATAAAVFNDSGVVAATLMLAPTLCAVVETALCEPPNPSEKA